ncbi:MAG: transposase [Planctomycetes bacterium]|nr:transposase [Planctomycetota bacterium]
MTRTRYRFDDEPRPHFITSTVVAWLSVFNRPEAVDIVFDSWRFLQREGMTLHGYVVLDNHLHWIANGQNMSQMVGRFKSFTARRIIDLLTERGAATLLEQLHYYKLRHKIDQDYQLWQEGSHPQAILDDEMMLQKLEYIHNNPVRRGFVDRPEDWRYSSARNYAGRSGLIDVVTDWR